MLAAPKIFESHLFIANELDYKWEDKDCQTYLYEYINEKLSKTLWGLNHKSTVGLATAIAEWILWQLSSSSKQQDFAQEFNALEAMWASQINKNYTFHSLYQSDLDEGKVMGPLWVTMKCIVILRNNYIKGKMFINEKVSTLAAIARLVSPDKKAFDDWLTDCIRRSIALFPAEYDRAECDDPRERYDSSHELPIPRAFFFEPDFDYSTADIDTLLANFISSLDYKNNEFLNSPEVMIEKGYVGIPYQYKGK